MKTMDDVYRDYSSHKICTKCELCIDCGDCKCGDGKNEN